jgi:hypothetical protein
MSDKKVLGFKKLTIENWQPPDDINQYFIRYNLETGEKKELTGNDRAENFLKYELSETVPIEIRRQFETARGAMLYGYYFYPLFALGADQLFRVAESATTHKCLILGIAKSGANYQIKLSKLKERNELTDQEFEDWGKLRKLRNLFTHSETQNLFPHWISAYYLKLITEKINNLFQN